MESLVDCVCNSGCVLDTNPPSYVNAFVTLTEGDVVLHKVLVKTSQVEESEVAELGNMLEVTNFDTTGSPLKWSLYSIKYDTTVFKQQMCWLPDEENHASLSLNEARTCLSAYFKKSQDHKYPPLWVVCDGKDKHRTLLLAGHFSEGWYINTKVCFLGAYPSNSPEMQPSYFEKKHLIFSTFKGSTKGEALEVYNLFNSGRGFMDKGDYSFIESNVKISVELTWNFTTLPLKDGHGSLVVEVNAGHLCSEVLVLWKQLSILHGLVNALNVCNGDRKKLVFPGNDVDGESTVREEILNLLHSESLIVNSYDECQDRSNLKQFVEQVIEFNQQNDFTSRLWMVLKGCTNIEELVTGFELVFCEFKKQKLQHFVRPVNQTTVAQILLKLINGEPALTLLTSVKALEMLIEIGIEKLSQDYGIIFSNLGITGIGEEVFTPKEGFAADLSRLTKLHAALEVLLVVQNYMNFSYSTLKLMASQVVDSCKNQDHKILIRDPLISVKIPVSVSDVKNRLPSQPSKQRFTFVTENDKRRVKSVFLCCSSFIFPPSIYTPAEPASILNGEENQFCFELLSNEDKWK